MNPFATVSRRFLPWIAVFVLAGSTLPASEVATRWMTLQAIHTLENPRNSPRPGRHGELGAYQFRPDTWRMHTKRPFREALNRKASDDVAVKHYEWLKRGLVAAGLPATPYNIALAWNSGLTSVIRGRSPKVSHDYAERATTIAAGLRARIVADAR